MGRSIHKTWHDDVCKASRVLLETCPTSFKLPSLDRYTLSSPTLFNPPSRTTSIYRCPEPTLPTVGDNPLESTGMFFFFSVTNDLWYAPFIGNPPYTGQNLVDIDVGTGEAIYHLDVDQVKQKIFTIEIDSGTLRHLKKRTYTRTDAGVITITNTEILNTWDTNDAPTIPFIERISLCRNKERLYVGTGGANNVIPYTIKEYDYAFNLLRTIRSETGTRIHWLVVDNDLTNIVYRRFGIGLDNTHDIREVDPSTLVMNQLFVPPTSTVASSHPVAGDPDIGKLYELSDGVIYETAYPTPVSYNALYTISGGGSAFSLFPTKQRFAYSVSTAGDIFWRNLTAGDVVQIFNASDNGLPPNPNCTRISSGVA